MDVTGRDRRVVLRVPDVMFSSVAFDRAGQRLAVGGSDGNVYVVRLDSPGDVRLLRGSGAPVQSVRFSRDGTRIVSGDLNGSVRVWNPETGSGQKSAAIPAAS